MEVVAEALAALTNLQSQAHQHLQALVTQQQDTMQQFAQHVQQASAAANAQATATAQAAASAQAAAAAAVAAAAEAPVMGPAPAPANNGTNHALRELSKNIKLQCFHGEKDCAELDTWVFQVEEYFAAVPGLGEEDKVRFGGVNLRGQAAAWWRDVGKTDARPKKWDDFVEELKRMFMPVARMQVARQKLANARQRDKENVTNYISYLRRLYLSIPKISEDEKVDRFIRGLNSQLQDKVGDRLDEWGDDEQITFEKAAAVAAKMEARMMGRRMGNWRSSKGGESSGATPMELGAMQSQGNKGYKGPPGQKDRPKGKGCWHCGEEGHIARHCPKKQQKGGNPKGNSPYQGYNY
jgi:hypothetical protein